ncbi:MAG: GNAT family N-acetyltransferase [Dehalococcoidia bacterium]
MKQIRRIEAKPSDAFRKLEHGALRYLSMSEGEFRELEREREGLIATEGMSVLVGLPRSAALDLQYTFPDRDAFIRDFPEMLQRVARAARLDEAPLGARFRLSAAPERAYVEPVLLASAFELSREWLSMVAHELPSGGATSNDVQPGFRIRGARIEDAEAIAELDAIAFAASFLTPTAARDLGQEPHAVRLLEDIEAERTAGFLRLRKDTDGSGYVSDLAVHPDYQRRGLGEAAMRWALSWFREQGMRRASLTVNTDNGPAIALYRKLGFVPDETGLDYRRPIDEEEVRQVLERRRTVRISVRRRVGR